MVEGNKYRYMVVIRDERQKAEDIWYWAQVVERDRLGKMVLRNAQRENPNGTATAVWVFKTVVLDCPIIEVIDLEENK